MKTPALGLQLVWLALLASCAFEEDESESTTAQIEGRQEGVREIVALLPPGYGGNWPAGLDPATNASSSLNLSIMNAIFGGLFQLTADSNGLNSRIEGVLASGYEVTNGGRTLIVHLRNGVRFSDGTLFDAEALRFNIERNIEAPCSCAPIRWPWADENRVVVIDDHTVALNFSRPYGAAINSFPILNVNWPVSPTSLAAMSEQDFRIRPVGAGPFKVVSNELSSRVVLERNPNYWETGKPFLDRLVFQSVESEQAAYFALLARDVQVVEGVVSTSILDQSRTHPDVKVMQQPATSVYMIQLNTLVPPFDDLRARQAIYLATDVSALRTGLFQELYDVSQSFTGPGGLFHHQRVPGYLEYDPARARTLVEDLGGLTVRLGTTPSFVSEQLVTALQSQWRRAGIDVSIELLGTSVIVEQLQSHNWEALLQRAGSYDPESASGSVALRFGSGQPFSGVADAVLDDILVAAATTVAESERDALYRDAAVHISDNAYAPFLLAVGPSQLAAKGVEGPGLTTPIPPIAIYPAIFWQDVRLGRN